jgi:hypothetical protein
MIVRKKTLPFFSFLAVLIILVTHGLVSATTPVLGNNSQCSILPVESINEGVKDSKAPKKNDQLTLKDTKPIFLTISEVSINQKGWLLNKNDKKSAALGDSIRVRIDGLKDAIDHGLVYSIANLNEL